MNCLLSEFPQIMTVTDFALIFRSLVCGIQRIYTVEPRYNEPLYNAVFGIDVFTLRHRRHAGGR